MTRITRIARKAIVGAAVSGLAALGVAAVDNAITLSEGIGALSAAVIAYGAVYGVTNKPAES